MRYGLLFSGWICLRPYPTGNPLWRCYCQQGWCLSGYVPVSPVRHELIPALSACCAASSTPSYSSLVTCHDLRSIRHSRHHPNRNEDLCQDHHRPLPHLVHRSMVRSSAIPDIGVAPDSIHNRRLTYGLSIRPGSHGTSDS